MMPSRILNLLRPLVLSLASVVLLWLSFPPVAFGLLAWIGLIPLFFLLDSVSTKRAAFGWSYLTGFLFFLILAYWVTGFVSSFFHPALGAALLIILAAYLGFYFAAAFFFWHSLKGQAPALAVFVFAAGWVVCEAARSATSFGYALLGHSQSAFLPVIQIADLTGSAGISFLVVAVNTGLFLALKDMRETRGIRREHRGLLLILGAVMAGVILYGVQGLSRVERGDPLRVSVVQANIPLAQTWDARQKDRIIDEHLDLSRTAMADRPDLIVWPETAFPPYIWEDAGPLERVRDFVRENAVPLLFGAVTHPSREYYNSALWLDRDGHSGEIYHKRHLVMFGEYIPLRRQIPLIDKLAPVDDFTAGQRAVLFEPKPGVKVSPLICVEDTVPGLARDAVRNGANVLVNLTNDAWFTDSPGARLHLQSALFRAVENRVPLVRSTNTGISCAIDSKGGIQGCVRNSQGREILIAGVGSFAVIPGSGGSFYTKFGDIFTLLCFLAILGTMVVIKISKRRKVS